MLKYFLIILKSPFYFLNKNPNSNPNVVAIFFLGKLGDMVCLTPMLFALRKNKPNSKIILIGNKLNKDLLLGVDFVDEYIVFTESEFFIKELKSKNISKAIVPGPSTDGLYVFLKTGVNQIICPKIIGGYSPYETLSYRFLRLFSDSVIHNMSKYAPREYLRLLEPLGIFTEDTTKHLIYSSEADNFASNIFADIKQPVVGIIITAGNKIKEWPLNNFADLIIKIKEKYKVEVVLIGGPNDLGYSENLKRMLPNSIQVNDFVGKLNIDQLKAFISKLHLLIGVDTGPIYIGEAFGIPTIDIVGPVAEYVQPPISDKHKVVVPPYERNPQLFIMNSRFYDKEESVRQIESITVEQVLKEVEDLCSRIF